MRSIAGSRLVRDCALLLLVAVVPAALTWWCVPSVGAASAARDRAGITVSDTRALGNRILWVDARSPEQFAAQHIPGALPLEPGDWNRQLPEVVRAWRPGGVMVVYCDASSCDGSREVAARLRKELQVREVFYLEGGWRAWTSGAR